MTYPISDEPFALGFLAEPSSHITKKTAAGLYRLFAEQEIRIDPETGLPMLADVGDIGIRYGHRKGIYCKDGLEGKAQRDPARADAYRALYREMRPYLTKERILETFSREERDAVEMHACWGGTGIGHANPNFADFAKYGTDGLRKNVRAYAAKNPEAAEFYEGLERFLDGIDVLGARVHDAAAQMLSELTDPDAVRKMQRLERTLRTCPKAPAKTFADACAVYCMVTETEGTDSPGHFDQYMIGFWRASDPKESEEMLEDLWRFFHKTRTWNLCISGSDESGRDLTNELSYAILDMAGRLRYQTPNLTMRCHANTPEALYRKAAETLATGCGLPALYNDEAVCPALERLGIPPEDSHRYVMNGCNQIDIQGKSHMGLEDGEVNLGKAVELALNDGVCMLSGKVLGCRTGDPAEFGTYEAFFEAVRAQIHFLCERAVSMSNKSQAVLAEIFSCPLRSLTIEGCLEKGREYKNQGPVYGHGQILIEGLADCVDSVAAVKRYVYEEKRFSIGTLAEALRADFEGYGDIYDLLRRSEFRFGNDIEEVDAVAAAIVDDYNRFLLGFRTFRGGRFGGGCSPFQRAEKNAKGTGALPSGKRARKGPYADSIGASPGKDTHGPTALLKSCLRFDQTLPTSGFILNLKFDRKQFGTETGQLNFLALVKAYFKEGGQQIQTTVVSREDLLDALEHPEDHGDLIVRVGGYCAYFTKLPHSLQSNVLARTSLEL